MLDVMAQNQIYRLIRYYSIMAFKNLQYNKCYVIKWLIINHFRLLFFFISKTKINHLNTTIKRLFKVLNMCLKKHVLDTFKTRSIQKKKKQQKNQINLIKKNLLNVILFLFSFLAACVCALKSIIFLLLT